MKRILPFLLLLVAVPATVSAEDDTRAYAKFSVNYEPTKKIKVGYSQQFRFRNDITEWYRWFNELSLSYKVNKNVKVGITQRLVDKPADDDFECCDHRTALDVGLSGELFDDLTLSSRLRWQLALKPESVRENVLRGRVGLKYEIKKWIRPFVNAETFVDTEPVLDASRYRFTGGLDVRPVKGLKFVPFYRIELDIEDDGDKNTIYGLSTSYTF